MTTYAVGVPEEQPLKLTRSVRDISATERQQFKTCRRRWELTVIDNLMPRIPLGMELDFGTGIHSALEAYYWIKTQLPGISEAQRRDPWWNLETAPQAAFDHWWEGIDERVENDKELTSEAKLALQDELVDLGDLAEEMIEGYYDYAAAHDDFTVHYVEGRRTGPGQAWFDKNKGAREFTPEVANLGAKLHESGRLLVPILDPDTQDVIDESRPCLSAKLDLVVLSRTPGREGIWIYDHKTTASAPGDRGLDFDDQVTAYCYSLWRWLGFVPRGVCFNYLIKKAPHDPQRNKDGSLSIKKDQLTYADWYWDELNEDGLVKKDRITSDKHRQCYEALLARESHANSHPFFQRHYVQRNLFELLSFERRLADEWEDMMDVYEGELAPYPNHSRTWCPGCTVSSLCQAMEDGSDWEHIRDSRYMQAPDRKAVEAHRWMNWS